MVEKTFGGHSGCCNAPKHGPLNNTTYVELGMRNTKWGGLVANVHYYYYNYLSLTRTIEVKHFVSPKQDIANFSIAFNIPTTYACVA